MRAGRISVSRRFWRSERMLRCARSCRVRGVQLKSDNDRLHACNTTNKAHSHVAFTWWTFRPLQKQHLVRQCYVMLKNVCIEYVSYYSVFTMVTCNVRRRPFRTKAFLRHKLYFIRYMLLIFKYTEFFDMLSADFLLELIFRHNSVKSYRRLMLFWRSYDVTNLKTLPLVTGSFCGGGTSSFESSS